MIGADVIVMATPVYFYTMNAQMKTLIDRTVGRYAEIRNKTFCFIVSAADGDKKTWRVRSKGFRGFLCCLDGAKEKGLFTVWARGGWATSSRAKP